MTKQECVIIMAFTGYSMLRGRDMDLYYAYIEEKLGRPVMTHELMDKRVMDVIQEKSAADFVALARAAE